MSQFERAWCICCKKDEDYIHDKVCWAGHNILQHVPSFYKPSPENKMYFRGYFVSLLSLCSLSPKSPISPSNLYIPVVLWFLSLHLAFWESRDGCLEWRRWDHLSCLSSMASGFSPELHIFSRTQVEKAWLSELSKWPSSSQAFLRLYMSSSSTRCPTFPLTIKGPATERRKGSNTLVPNMSQQAVHKFVQFNLQPSPVLFLSIASPLPFFSMLLRLFYLKTNMLFNLSRCHIKLSSEGSCRADLPLPPKP